MTLGSHLSHLTVKRAKISGDFNLFCEESVIRFGKWWIGTGLLMTACKLCLVIFENRSFFIFYFFIFFYFLVLRIILCLFFLYIFSLSSFFFFLSFFLFLLLFKLSFLFELLFPLPHLLFSRPLTFPEFSPSFSFLSFFSFTISDSFSFFYFLYLLLFLCH